MIQIVIHMTYFLSCFPKQKKNRSSFPVSTGWNSPTARLQRTQATCVGHAGAVWEGVDGKAIAEEKQMCYVLGADDFSADIIIIIIVNYYYYYYYYLVVIIIIITVFSCYYYCHIFGDLWRE